MPYLLNTFASNVKSLIPKSKSSTTTTNLTFTIRTISIMQKKMCKTYINEFNNKEIAFGEINSCKSTQLAKHTSIETHTCKVSKKINQQMVKA
jgi:hypothetical protein